MRIGAFYLITGYQSAPCHQATTATLKIWSKQSDLQETVRRIDIGTPEGALYIAMCQHNDVLGKMT